MKTFTKKAAVAAVLSVLAAPALAAPTVYGKAHVSVGSISEDTGTETSATAVSSHASRFGVKGDIATDGDTKIVYKFEWQVDMTDNAKASDNNIKSRNMYVGLKGGWGEVHIGREDSPYKVAGKKSVEHLSDTWADFNNIIDKGQDTRNDNSISYSNKIGPGKLGIAYSAGDDAVDADNAETNMSFAYDMKIDNISFAIAHQNIEESTTNDETGLKISVGAKFGNTQVGLMSEKVEDDGTLDDTNTFLSLKQKLSDTNSLVVAYGKKDEGKAKDAAMTAVSFQHKLDKKASIYALWADGSDDGLKAASKLDGDASALVVGLIAKF